VKAIGAWKSSMCAGISSTVTPGPFSIPASGSANTNSSPPRARTSCMFAFSFSTSSLFGATTITGMSASTSARGRA
jgi:hypothetical protein